MSRYLYLESIDFFSLLYQFRLINASPVNLQLLMLFFVSILLEIYIVRDGLYINNK